MINENENERIENESTREIEETSPETADTPETPDAVAEEGAEITPAEETSAPEPEKREIYAFRWSYGEQYVHDREESAAAGSVKTRKKGSIAVFVTVVVLAFAIAFGLLFLSLSFDDMARWFAGDPEAEMKVTEIVEKGMPSTVTVYSNKGTGMIGAGSGFVINDMGYVVTNYHVVENSLGITVLDVHGKFYSATLIGYNKANDMAVLHVENCRLPAVTVGDSDQLKLGETVVAIGTPGGDELAFSVSDGTVSGLKRRLSSKSVGMIQINAPVNPGNSGGPLFDSRGNLVGIVTMKYTFTSLEEDGQNLPYDGVAFALPITDLIGEIESIMRGDLDTPRIGITGMSTEAGNKYFYYHEKKTLYAYEKMGNNDYYVDENGSHQLITDEMRKNENNLFLESEAKGVLVTDVTKGLGADGLLQIGDVIVEANGVAVTTIGEFRSMIEKLSVGDGITVTFYRNGEKKTARITVMTKHDMLKSDR